MHKDCDFLWVFEFVMTYYQGFFVYLGDWCVFFVVCLLVFFAYFFHYRR